MKKFFLALSLSLAVVLTTAAHPATGENPRAEQAFKKMFAGASHVNWSETNEDLLKVSFVWGDHRTIAFFDKDAQLVGSIRGLFFKELPLSVTKSVTDNFNNPVVLQANEVFNEEGVNYILVIENKGKKYNVRLNTHGQILKKERIKK
ncbi:MAG: hypothetical protein ACXWWD_09355 [Chitinophagaceae bacterium]